MVRLAALNRLLRLYAALHQIQVVDLAPVICPGGGPACPDAVNGVVMRPDGYHIGPGASPVVAAQVLPQAIGIAPDPQSASPTTADAFARLYQRVPSAAAWAEISHPWRPAGDVTGIVARRGQPARTRASASRMTSVTSSRMAAGAFAGAPAS